MPMIEQSDEAGAIDPGNVEFFDFENDEEYRKDPQGRLNGLRDRHRLFYTPKGRKSLLGGGTWVFTHGADIRAVLQDPETFRSSGNRPFGKALGENWVLVPIDLDPPEHTRMRKFMNPLFSPKRVAELAGKVERRAVELITPLQGRQGCSFIEDFARPFPVTIFLEMFGLPVSEMPKFVDWVEAIIHSQGQVQLDAMRELRDYLAIVIEDRRQSPRDDLISLAVTAEIEGKALTYDELMGMCIMLFMGGLDTVTSSLSFIFRHLAENPEHQEFLRKFPDMIPTAIEELLRAYPIITTGRIASRDVDFDGIVIRKGENVACPLACSSRDPDEIDGSTEIDLTRNPNRHSAFGFGPHRCIGSHLARRELVVAVEQWLKLLQPFRLPPNVQLSATGAGVVALDTLPLVW
ncbi:MAG: cytochrome P450 [Novosphingobium sp.]|nr:cytochrome P450 [Novosphingobium sp.]MCP5403620.1 cytochrome P450 [Novosphingobium sp.]